MSSWEEYKEIMRRTFKAFAVGGLSGIALGIVIGIAMQWYWSGMPQQPVVLTFPPTVVSGDCVAWTDPSHTRLLTGQSCGDPVAAAWIKAETQSKDCNDYVDRFGNPVNVCAPMYDLGASCMGPAEPNEWCFNGIPVHAKR